MKRELHQHILRIWRPCLILYFLYIISSFYFLNNISSLISWIHSIDAPAFATLYSTFYINTLIFGMLLLGYYAFQTSYDYIKGKNRWGLLKFTKKQRLYSDILLCIGILLILYVINLCILVISYYLNVRNLSKTMSQVIPFLTFIQSNTLSYTMYPTTAFTLCLVFCFLFYIVMGTLSLIYMFKKYGDAPFINSLLYIASVLLLYIAYHSSLYSFTLVCVIFGFIFMYQLRAHYLSS